jgi:hypothetical protein
MEDFHCDALELSLRFPSEDFDQDLFFKAGGVEDREKFTDEDGDFSAALSFGGREESTSYHCHIKVRFYKTETKDRIDITYHDSSLDEVETSPPYAEDCAQWLASFFKVDKVDARISATYVLDSSFSLVLGLPFPLISSEKALTGSIVTGLSILFPKGEQTESAIIQTTEKNSIIIFNTSIPQLSLKDFDLFAELKRLSLSVNSLIRKQENNSETRKDND